VVLRGPRTSEYNPFGVKTKAVPSRNRTMSAFSRTCSVLALLVPVAPARAADDEKDIRAVLDAQAAAWNKGDLDGFMAGYWNDDKLTFISGGNITFGWKATKERYVKRYQADGKEMGKLTFGDLHTEVLAPSAAVVRGKFELVFENAKDDKKKTARGRFTLIMKKFPDGWKVVHDHTSAEEVK
jgi:uncharacterized protein (TIGR02246 family)